MKVHLHGKKCQLIKKESEMLIIVSVLMILSWCCNFYTQECIFTWNCYDNCNSLYKLMSGDLNEHVFNLVHCYYTRNYSMWSLKNHIQELCKVNHHNDNFYGHREDSVTINCWKGSFLMYCK